MMESATSDTQTANHLSVYVVLLHHSHVTDNNRGTTLGN